MLELADVTLLCIAVANKVCDEVREGGCDRVNSSVTPHPFSPNIFPSIPHLIVFHPSCGADVT